MDGWSKAQRAMENTLRKAAGHHPAAAALAAMAIALPGSAWAADVDLTVAVNVPTTTTLTPFTYTVTIGNAQSPATLASNSALTLPLPANLYNVSVVGVSASGGADCPTPASFAGVPTGLTDGSGTLSATIASLPSNGFCTVTVQATPLSANSYSLGASVQPGAGDNETRPATNQSSGNTATVLASARLKIDKTIIGGATLGANGHWNGSYGTPITYQVSYQNLSALDLPLGAMNDLWDDWEGAWTPQSMPASSTHSNLTCTVTGSGTCPTVTQSTSGVGTEVAPVTMDLAGFVLRANSTVTITYRRTFQAPTCGTPTVHDDVRWLSNRAGSFFSPIWQPNSSSTTGSNTAGVTLDLPPSPAGACVDIPINWKLSKSLDSLTDANGTVKASAAPFQVTANGDTLHYTVVIDNTATPPSTVAGADLVPFSLWDVVKSIAGGQRASPTVIPAGGVQQQISVDNCSASGPGSQCLLGIAGYPFVVQPYSTNFERGSYAEVKVKAGERMTIRLSTTYRIDPAVQCVNIFGQVNNEIGVTVQPAPAGYAYQGETYQWAESAYASILPNLPRCADVSSNKTVNPVNPNAGEPITFTLDYTNSTSLATGNPYNAPNPLTNVAISDALGASFTPSAASCSVLQGTATPPSVGLGSITGPNHLFQATIPSINDGATVRCVITGAVTLPGSYRNVTSVAFPAGSGLLDPFTTNNVSSVNYGVIGAIVGLTKTVLSGGAAAGGPVSYAVTVTNAGVVPANGTVVVDTPPADIVAYSWTCSATGGAVCPRASSGASGAGGSPINETVATFPAGAVLTYTLTGTLSNTPSSATLTNAASATPPANSSCAPDYGTPPCVATASTTLPQVNLTKTSSAGTAALTPGGTVTYTVVASNPGPAAAGGAAINDAVPTGIASQTWACSAAGGAVCPAAGGSGAIAQTISTFPAQSSLTYVITAQVSSAPPATVINAAALAPPPGGLCVQSGTTRPCTATVTNPPVAQISVRKTSSAGTAALTPGGSVTYTVLVSNSGSVAANGTAVTDPVPAGIDSLSWTCAASGGAVCPVASGTGALNQLVATLPAGSSVTYTLTGQVSANPPAQVVNTATATPPAGAICASGGQSVPCASTVANPPGAQIALRKTSSAGSNALTPGSSVTYVVTASNMGNGAGDGAVLTDPVPTGIASQTWMCTSSGGAVCPAASGTGAINQTVANFPAGGMLTYTVTAQVAPNPPPVVTNTASVVPPPGGVCAASTGPATCSASVSNPPGALVSIAKSSSGGAAALTPGGSVTYSVLVSNNGSVAASGTAVSDPVPSGIASQTWTCIASGGATCPQPSGSGAIQQTIANLPPGASVTYAITAQVAATPPATVVNTATLTPPAGGQCGSGAGAAACEASVSDPPGSQLSVTKSASTVTVAASGIVDFNLNVRNTGAVAAGGTVVSDPLAPGVVSQSWTCSASGGASCPAASGEGAISQTIAVLPAGGELTYAIHATVSATPPQTVTNTANVQPPAGGTCGPGNTAAPCTASASVAGPTPPAGGGGTPTPVPVNEPWMLALLLVLLAATGVRARRQF